METSTLTSEVKTTTAQKAPPWTRNNVDKLFRAGAVLLLVFFLIPDVLYHLPGIGLDPSWQIALHLAIQNGAVFGDDFMFTYGPLGFFATRLTIGISPYIYVFFYLYVLSNCAYILNYALKNNNKYAAFAISFLLVIHIQNFYDRDISIILSSIFIFMIFMFLKKRNMVFLVNALFLTSLIFFIKVSLGVVSVFNLIFTHAITIKRAGVIAGVFAAYLGLACVVLKVNLFTYLLGSLQLISGYNTAMFVPQPLEEIRLVTALVILSFFIALCLWNIRIIFKDSAKIFIFGCISLLLYVIFKNGFVRDHSNSFFIFTPVAFGLLYLFSGRLKGAVLYVLLLSIFAGYLGVGGLSTIFSPSLFSRKLNFAGDYGDQLIKYNSDSVNINYKVAAKIPESIAKTIGTKSADIIPGEISYLFYNDLPYNPRPVIQSYSAYNSYLDQQNADKYTSDSAPDFVLIQQYSFEDRNALYDETKTKLALLANYEVVNSEWNHLLLKKLEKPVGFKTVKSEESTGRLSQNIVLEESDGLQIMSADVEYSLLGKLMSFLLEPAPLFVAITMEDGTEQSYRAATSILKGGVIVNRHLPIPEDLVDLELFVNFYGEKNSRVKIVRFFTDSPWAFKGDFDFAIQQVAFEAVTKGPSTGSGLSSPVDKALPGPAQGKQYYNIEKSSQSNNSYYISGWSFLPDVKDNKSVDMYVVFQPSVGNKSFVFPTTATYRPDVAAHFERPDIDSSGFALLVRKEFLPPGSYNVGLLAEAGDSSLYELIGDEVLFQDNKIYEPQEKAGWIADSVVYNLEGVHEGKFWFQAEGWAYLTNADNSQVTLSLVVENDKQFRIYHTFAKPRPDVRNAFSRNDITHAGFSFNIPKAHLEPGKYKLGLLIQHGERKIYKHIRKSINFKQ
jgi:hypothetical protein